MLTKQDRTSDVALCYVCRRVDAGFSASVLHTASCVDADSATFKLNLCTHSSWSSGRAVVALATVTSDNAPFHNRARR